MNSLHRPLIVLASVILGLLSVPPAARAQHPALKISPLDSDHLRVQLTAAPPAMDPAYRALLENERQFFRNQGRNLPPLVSAYNQFGVLHVEFDSLQAREDFERDKLPGVFVFSCIERFADLFVESLESFQRIERHPAVRWIDVGNLTKVPNPGLIGIQADDRPSESVRPSQPAAAPARVACEDVIRSGDRRIGGLTGKGAIIVIIDTGIDFRNSDFIDLSRPTSRILYYWDALIYMNPRFAFGAELPPIAAPNGQPMGIVYTQEGLSKDLREKLRSVPLYDIQGHGTSCAGVAAGNAGNARGNPAAETLGGPCLGAAAEADLIIVRIAWLKDVQYSFLLGAIIDWVEDKARTDPRMKGRPIVYSCSWGSDSGDRAGNQVLERQLNARFPLDKPGRAICIAAGNDGRSAHHGRAFLDAGKLKLVWETRGPDASETRTGQGLTLYFGGVGDKSHLAVEYIPPARVAGPEREQIKQAVQADFNQKTFRHGILGSLVTDARWNLPTGTHELHFTIKAGSRLTIEDAYISPMGNSNAEFLGQSRQYGKQIGFPAGSSHAVTVGSYDWNPRKFDRRGELTVVPMAVGEVSDYSNPGPVRSGAVVKPDIVAPGQFWLVSQADPRQLIGPRKYRAFNGTSAATPYVAGVIALMMEKKPTITVGEIKQLLATHATRDPGKLLPESRRDGWGNGKLDAESVERIFRAIR